MSKTFDLSTLDLPAGTHNVTVKSRAAGYADSPASNAIVYIKGKNSSIYAFEANPTLSEVPASIINAQFVCDGETYNSVRVADDLSIQYDDTTVFSGNAWASDKYKYVEFLDTSQISQAWYDWLIDTKNGAWIEDMYGRVYLFNRSFGHSESRTAETHISRVRDVLFMSNGVAYTALCEMPSEAWSHVYYNRSYRIVLYALPWTELVRSSLSMLGYENADGSVKVYTQYKQDTVSEQYRNAWANEVYRTIIPQMHITDKNGYLLYGILSANAVQQTFAFTIDSTTYYAESGMTWAEWVESEYNTDGWYIDTYAIPIDGSTYLTKNGGSGVNITSNPDIIANAVYFTEPYRPI